MWYTASVTNHGGEPCGDPKPFGHAIRRYTNEIYLERPEKHHSDPRRCGGDNSGLRHHDGKRPVADPLDGIRPRPAARQRPGAAGHGVRLRGAGVRHAGQSVQIPAPHRGGRGLCARQRDGPAAHQLVLCGGGGGLPGRGVHLSAVCVSGRGRGVHGAHCPGAEKRLCPGRPHEGRA